MANEEAMLYEDLYGIQPGIGHMHTFECIVRVARRCETHRKLDDQWAMASEGCKYEGKYKYEGNHC